MFAALFIILPLIEIFLFIKVGGVIGALPTVLLVVATAVAGIALLRHQGLSTLRRAQRELERGEMPALSLLEGAALLVAGVLLLTPGFLTDTLGFLLLIPPLRRRFVLWLLQRMLRPAYPPVLEGKCWKDN
ncbi:MAG: FxsA family protein [Gammaproteobacteria bacterium]|nr:MAG: FxsA family protein [Gammaproteobacteria bacterium]